MTVPSETGSRGVAEGLQGFLGEAAHPEEGDAGLPCLPAPPHTHL